MNSNKQNSAGFVGVVFLAIALIGVIIAAVATMSREKASGTANESLRSSISVMFKQAADYKLTFDRMVADGIEPTSISIAEDEGGMFFPNNGIIYGVEQRPPSTIQLASNSPIMFTQNAELPGIGDDTSGDSVAVVRVRTLAICQMINNMLYGDSLSATPALSTDTAATWTSQGSIADGALTAPNYRGRPEGCIRTNSPTAWIYYKALHEQ